MVVAQTETKTMAESFVDQAVIVGGGRVVPFPQELLTFGRG